MAALMDLPERLRAAATYQNMPMAVRKLLWEAAEALADDAFRDLEREPLAALHRLQHTGTPAAKPKPGGSIVQWAADEIASLRLAHSEPRPVAGEAQVLRETLIKMGRMLPGVQLDDRVSSDLLTYLPGELEAALATHSPAPTEAGWQDIETADRDCMTEIDMWCASAEADGEGWNLRGILMIGTPDWIKREDASDYFPHENGGFLTHWRPLPPAPSTQGGAEA